MTNREKFKEEFGFVPIRNVQMDMCPQGFDCEDIPSCRECPFDRNWWEIEYKPCFKLKEGFND